jgi:hypothetical protein
MIRIPVCLIYFFFFLLFLLNHLNFLLFLYLSPFVRLKSFRRWMSETCLPCPPTKLDNNEPYVFSFYEDIVQVNRLACFPFLCLLSYVCACCLLNEKYRKISFTLISSIWKNVYHCLIHAYLFLLIFLAKPAVQSGGSDVDKSCLSQFKSLEIHFCLSVCLSVISIVQDINKAIDFILFQEITLVFLFRGMKLNEIKMKFCYA